MSSPNCVVTVTGNLFVGQSAPYELPITITSDSVDLTEVDDVEVEWIPPSGTTLLWTALDVIGTPTPTLLVVSHVLDAGGLDVPVKGKYRGNVNLLMPSGGPRWCYTFQIEALERR